MTEPHFAHLEHPRVQDAERAWEEHVAGCAQCQAAPGPPPPDVKPEDRVLYACEEGLQLQEAAVRVAHAAFREARDGR